MNDSPTIVSGPVPETSASLTPRLSWQGSALIYLSCLLLSLASLLAVFYVDLKSDLSGYVSTRVESIDRLLGLAVSEMRSLPESVTADCSGPTVEALVRASMDSAIVRRFYQLPAGGELVCSPLPLIDDIAAKQLSTQGRLLDGPINVIVLPGANSDFVVVSKSDSPGSENKGSIAAQIPGAVVWDLLRVREKTRATIRIDTWAGTNLLDTGWDDSTGYRRSADLIRIQKDSSVLPMSVSARISISNAVAGAVRYGLSSLLIAALLSVLLIGQINYRIRGNANPMTRLNAALKKREFEPFIQPIVDCNSGSCVGGEILMRWQHPIRGTLSPFEFIDLAERSGLIDPMTELVMLKARERLKNIVQQYPHLYFSFNVTVSQLQRPGFPDELDAIFDKESLCSENVVIELIERGAIDVGSRRTIAELRRRGYRIAIDDFGTGQSSLALLTSMSFDLLKIDREFVRAIDSESVHRSVIAAIVELASQLGVRSIAEGVETTAQHRFLIGLGVQSIQGFLIARPMSIKNFETWLHEYHPQNRYSVSEQEGRVANQPASPATVQADWQEKQVAL